MKTKENTITIEQLEAAQVAEEKYSICAMKKDIRSCLRLLKTNWQDCYDQLHEGCLMFDTEALDLAAEILEKEKEYNKALNLYVISALFGSTNAMFHAGEIMIASGEKEAGICFIQDGAEEGDVRCMILLSVCYRAGWCVEEEDSIREKWEKKVEELDPYGYEYVRLMAESEILFRNRHNRANNNSKN